MGVGVVRGGGGGSFGEGGVSLLAHFLNRGAAFGVEGQGRGRDGVGGVEGEEGAVGLVEGVEFGGHGGGVERRTGYGFCGRVEVEGEEGESFVHRVSRGGVDAPG